MNVGADVSFGKLRTGSVGPAFGGVDTEVHPYSDLPYNPPLVLSLSKERQAKYRGWKAPAIQYSPPVAD